MDYPDVRIVTGRKFAFRPPRTIMVGEEEPSELLMMHELGHYLCGHVDFAIDADRLRKEREAWEKAREVCDSYGVEYVEEVVERELDTYRNWLDKKSRCPKCGLTRFQTPDRIYHCPKCDMV